MWWGHRDEGPEQLGQNHHEQPLTLLISLWEGFMNSPLSCSFPFGNSSLTAPLPAPFLWEGLTSQSRVGDGPEQTLQSPGPPG